MVDWAAIRETALGSFTLAELPPNMSLPALPLAVTRFVEKSNDPDASGKDLGKIVETDSGLTLELLKHVNSAFVGLKSKASSVTQAIQLLGVRASKNLIVTVGTKGAIQSRQSKLINQNCFWNGALQKALFAKEVALLLKTDGELAFSAALLQDYLLPVLTNDLFEPYMKFVELRDKERVNLVDYERQVNGFDHALAAAGLAQRWKLPDDLTCCILFHHRGLEILTDKDLGRTPAAAVAISALLPDQLRQSYSGLEQLMLLEQKWPAFNLQKLAETVDAKQAELGMGVHNDFPLSRRCKSLEQQQANNADGTLRATAA
jgi:HD-like signal output (HDOD) protein